MLDTPAQTVTIRPITTGASILSANALWLLALKMLHVRHSTAACRGSSSNIRLYVTITPCDTLSDAIVVKGDLGCAVGDCITLAVAAPALHFGHLVSAEDDNEQAVI